MDVWCSFIAVTFLCVSVSTGTDTQIDHISINQYAVSLKYSIGHTGTDISLTRVNLNVTSTDDSDTITGDDLWKVELYAANTIDGSGPVTVIDDDLLSVEQSSKNFTAGETMSLEIPVFTDVNLYMNFTFFCVKLSKSPNANPNFEFQANANDYVKLCLTISFGDLKEDVHEEDFHEEDFHKVIIASSEFHIGMSSADPLNKDAGIAVDYTLEFSDISSFVIAGDMWVISIYASENADGSGNKRSISVAGTPISTIVPGEQQSFHAEARFDFEGIGPGTKFPYICVLLSERPIGDLKIDYKGSNTINHCTPLLDLSKTCRLWGDPHYKTFDGYGFTFQGDLEYLAVQTCNNEDGRIPEFQVVTDNYRRIESMPVTYIRELRLEYNDVAYALTHPDKVSVDEVEVTLPYVDRNNGITIYYAAPYKILTTDFGVILRQDNKHNTDIEVPIQFQNRLCGLCGNFDGVVTNECHYRDGSNMYQRNKDCTRDFTDQWVYFPDNHNATIPRQPGELIDPEPLRNCSEGSSYLDEARRMCEIVSNTSGPIADCHEHLSPNLYYKTCVYDLCQLLPYNDFLCGSVETYLHECAKESKGTAQIGDWRTVTGCESCPEGMTFDAHNNACHATCAEPDGADTECPLSDLETCRCPDGLLLDGTRCVTPEECGCRMDSGRYLSLGEEFMNSDCTESCNCTEGQHLQCTEVTCAGNATCLVKNNIKDCYCDPGYKGNPREECPEAAKTCRIYGDPHFNTFDEVFYSFQGDCTYIAAKTCGDLPPGLYPFTIYIHTDALIPEERYTYLTMIQLSYRNKMYKFRMNGHVTVNGVSIADSLPYTDEENNVNIVSDGKRFEMYTDFGLRIIYDDENDASIKLPPSYFGSVCGLCGNADDDDSNEKQKPDGTSAKKLEFANSWGIEGCPSLTKDVETCETGSEIERTAIDICSELTRPGGQFSNCHDFQNPEVFYKTCVYDLCGTLPYTNMFCNSIEQYLEACEDKGGKPSTKWRNKISYCSLCPEGYKNYRGSCYQLFTYSKKQYQAKRQCETNGAHLVTISSRLENKFITRFTNNIRTWIGGERDDLASSRLIRSSGDDTYSYPLLRLSNGAGSFGFSVDAESDVHIILSPVREPDVHTPLYEIAIGQYGSRTNSIRRCMECESLVEDTTTFLMAGVDKFFIVNFHDGLIQVTQHLSSHIIMEYSDLQPINVHYVSFRTNGQPGTFTLFDNQFKWISGEKWRFDNYRFGETNNKRNTEDCLEINFQSPGLWNDHFCNMRKPFVCETDPETI